MREIKTRTGKATLAVIPELWDAYKRKCKSVGALPSVLFEVWMKSFVDPDSIMHKVEEMQKDYVKSEVQKALKGKKEK
jgi:hypothetical protein